MKDLPNLSRTRDAIAEYDTLDAAFRDPALWDGRGPSIEVASSKLAELERAGEAVGAAFGEDTKDRNSPETCRQCVRPGPAVPSVGAELSFVRRMVRDWETTF